MVSPDTDTDRPKWLSAAPSEAVSLAVRVASDQPPLGFTNTYAEPELIPLSSSPYAPTTMVSPDTDANRAGNARPVLS